MTERPICLEQSLEWPNKFEMKKKEQFILTVMDMPLIWLYVMQLSSQKSREMLLIPLLKFQS